ncbi:helix-turn-helix domain-containing protein [Bacillus cereus]
MRVIKKINQGVVTICNLIKKEKKNTKEAAKQLNIAESTLHKYVKDGLIKPVYDDWKQDGSRLFYVDDIERLAESIKKPKGITISELAKKVR